jgi:hypothetical protein
MTHDQLQTIQDDLAYMRALAQEGRRAPLLGGSVLIAGGLIYGGAALAHWMIAAGVLDVPPISYSVLWLVAVVAFFVVLGALKRRMSQRPGATAANNRAYSIAWGGLGGATFGIAASLIIAAARMKDPVIMGLFPPVILSLYGGGWLVGAALSDRSWLRWVGFAAIAAALGTALLIGRDEQWLAYAAALILLAALPGYALARQAPTDTV